MDDLALWLKSTIKRSVTNTDQFRELLVLNERCFIDSMSNWWSASQQFISAVKRLPATRPRLCCAKLLSLQQQQPSTCSLPPGGRSGRALLGRGLQYQIVVASSTKHFAKHFTVFSCGVFCQFYYKRESHRRRRESFAAKFKSER